MSWQWSIELSESEQIFCSDLGVRSRFYCFLRRVRHRIFDDAFTAQLKSMYVDRPGGLPPVPPQILAMSVILQAYTKASDAEAIECVKADRRWQLVLGCVGGKGMRFSQKTLVFFRQRLLETGMDEELLARTVELGKESGLFDPKKLGKLRIAIDSAPLEGAGRVLDTINMIGGAIRVLARTIAAVLGISPEEISAVVGLTIVGDRSVKACLDIDWDDQQAQRLALRKLVHEAQQLERWLEEQSVDLKNDAQVRGAIDTLRKVIGQDTEPDPDGSGIRVKQGVAPDRQISLSDPDMRHGRKSSAQRIDGYKRYAACDLDSGLTLAAGVLPANVPEHVGADKLRSEIEEHGKVDELHQDRAFLPSELTQDVYASGDSVIAKPYSNANGELFSKQQFDVNLQAGTVECPAGNSAPIVGDRAKFSAKKCAACPLRSQCQKETARDGRTIAIQSNEAMLQQLHQQVGTTTGRQKLRERVKIEHKLAHHCRVQGPRARYRGTRNNDFDARRTATVTNLAVLAARYPAGLERAA